MVDIVSIWWPFSAGVLVLLSPCGYALIPGYISYHLGSEVSVSRALQGGIISTIGLVAVFSILGFSFRSILRSRHFEMRLKGT